MEAPRGNTPETPRHQSDSWTLLTSASALRIHRIAFTGVIGSLTVINVFTGGGWWAFWPLLGWGIVFFFHLCLVRAIHVQDDWVDERTDDIRLKSYDLGHMDSIEERYRPEGVRPSASRRARRLSAAEQAYPIIDAHHHLWDLSANHHPWLCDETPIESRHGDYRTIRTDYLPEDFRADWAGLNVVKTVHVEAEWDREDEVGETRWLHELNERHGIPSAIVAHARLDDPEVERVLAAHAEFPLVRGIRHKPTAAAHPGAVEPGAPGSMGDPAWRRGFAALRRHGFAFDLQTPYWHLAEAAELARDFPKTLIIINHAGLPVHRDRESLAEWRAAMEQAAAARNMVVKISGLGEPHLQPWTIEKHRDVVLDIISIFGVERCMFGSNFPVDRLYAPYSTIMRGYLQMTAGFSVRERRWLFRDNAAAYYRIEL